MNLADQYHTLKAFHEQCLEIIAGKGPDYAPDGVPLLDMVATCVEADISLPQGLWVLYRKHFSAIRKHYLLNQPLTSEPIENRLVDAANYFGLLYFWEVQKKSLMAAWRRHWEAQTCESDLDIQQHHVPTCPRCATLLWLDMQALKLGFDPTWWDSTPRAQD